MTERPSIWLRPARSVKGPVPGFDRRDLAEAGVSLADEHGLGAVTMRAVAGILDTSSASLYRYVATRDELLELMVDHTLGEVAPATAEAAPWAERLLDLARSLREVCLRHPWLLDAGITGRDVGPSAVTNLESGLAALAEHPASTKTKLEAIGVLNSTVVSLCRFEVDQKSVGGDVDRWRREQADHLARMIDPSRHPHLVAAFRESDSDPERESGELLFDRIVTRVLAGLLPPEDYS